MNFFYITTTLPYVNAAPHLGHSLEFVQADAMARWRRSKGDEVFFNTGTDEHGAKVYQKAQKEGKSIQNYVDENAIYFKRILEELNIDLQKGRFIRTTDQDHIAAAQEFWRVCDSAGDIYKATYRIKYCIGCELEKTDSELEGGRCPVHPNLEIEEREEENYFFRFSKYQNQLLELYKKIPNFVVPEHRLTEIRNFVSSGLNDFSISRLKTKMPWGVPVPGDDDHVIYVWFDALVNYISTLGWPNEKRAFELFWGTKENPKAIQIAGKDNLRQQSAMWQAMLLSAGLPTSRQVMIHGFITSSGEKMAKSIGNVIDPFDIIEKYGTDALRYYLLREIPTYGDGEFSIDKLEARYNGDLANGLGNFASRVLALSEKEGDLKEDVPEKEIIEKIRKAEEEVDKKMGEWKFHEALGAIWDLISFGDVYVNQNKVWAISEKENKKKKIMNLVLILHNIASLAGPFLPGAAGKILESIKKENNLIRTKRSENLFPRIG